MKKYYYHRHEDRDGGEWRTRDCTAHEIYEAGTRYGIFLGISGSVTAILFITILKVWVT